MSTQKRAMPHGGCRTKVSTKPTNPGPKRMANATCPSRSFTCARGKCISDYKTHEYMGEYESQAVDGGWSSASPKLRGDSRATARGIGLMRSLKNSREWASRLGGQQRKICRSRWK